MIMSGQVEVIKGLGTENARVLAKRGPEEVFGEMAILGKWPRIASVRAVDQFKCLGLDRWVFLTQLEAQPQLSMTQAYVIRRAPVLVFSNFEFWL